MKKISLKNLNLNEVDQLSREQLKNVLGGYTGDGTSRVALPTTTAEENYDCNCSSGRHCFVDPGVTDKAAACKTCCDGVVD